MRGWGELVTSWTFWNRNTSDPINPERKNRLKISVSDFGSFSDLNALKFTEEIFETKKLN